MSIEFTFEGETAHSAGAPWRGRSALDAVELMSIGWQYRREHLRLSHRSHSVITNGGDQPNVVPRNASIWFYFREIDQPNIKELVEIGIKMAEGAALMTNTKMTSRILGTAYPRHFNKVVAETMYENIKTVGLPTWSDADQALAKGAAEGARQRDAERPGREAGRAGPAAAARETTPAAAPTTSATFPGTCRPSRWAIPANIPGLPGHNWSSGIASATPIAHKGVVAGAKVQAMTVLDLLTKPELVKGAWDYFNNVQTKDVKYIPFITRDTPPADALEQGDSREVSRADAEVLLRPDEVPDLSRSAGDQVPDGAGDSNVTTGVHRECQSSEVREIQGVLDHKVPELLAFPILRSLNSCQTPVFR